MSELSERVEPEGPEEVRAKAEGAEGEAAAPPVEQPEPVFDLRLRYPEEFEAEPDMFEAMVDCYAAMRGLEGDRKRAAVKLARALSKIGGPGRWLRRYDQYFTLMRNYMGALPDTDELRMIRNAVMAKDAIDFSQRLKERLFTGEDVAMMRQMIMPVLVLRELLRFDTPNNNSNSEEVRALREEIKALREMFEEHLRAEEERKLREEIKAIEDRVEKRIGQLEGLIRELTAKPRGEEGGSKVAERWFGLLEGLINAQREELQALRSQLSERDKATIDRLQDRLDKLEDALRGALRGTGPSSPMDAVKNTVEILKSTKELIDTARSLPQTPESEKVAKYRLGETIANIAGEVALEAVKAAKESGGFSGLSEGERRAYEAIGELIASGRTRFGSVEEIAKTVAERTGMSLEKAGEAVEGLVEKGLLNLRHRE